MGLTIDDYKRASQDPKFMAARWKQRVAISQRKLDEILSNRSLSENEKEMELRMHRNRIKKMEESQKKLRSL